MAAFTSTLRAVLEMDTVPFQRASKGAQLTSAELGRAVVKSARESAEAYKQTWAEEEKINEARRAQAEATNRSITAGLDRVTKSARESASVFQELFQKEEQLAKQREESSRQQDFGGDYAAAGVSRGARELAENLERSDGLISKIRSKFSAGSILTSVLSGVGIGSGFAIAEKAADLIASHWRKASEAAQRIAEFSDRQLDATLKIIRLRETDEQRLAKAQRREKSLGEQLGVAQRVGASPERIARLAAELQEATLERLEAEERVQQEIQKKREEAARKDRERRDRELQWQIEANERVREQEEAAMEAKQKAEKEAAKKSRERLDMVIEKTEEALDAEQRYRDALSASKRATDALATANRDRAAFSVSDAAAGRRGSPEEQRRARRIQELEGQAQRAFDRGQQVTERRDQRGNVVRETGEQESARLLREADQLRGGLGNRLVSGDRDPLADAKKSLKEALEEAETLKDIRDSLQPTAL